MTLLTFQVLEGMERGHVLSQLVPPLTIGREEDNGIQLNDERVSRFHAKVQVDSDRVILTDLESTNGTRVNGHPIKMHVLRIGDQISIGRCLLLFGSRDEIEMRIRTEQAASVSANGTISDVGSLFGLASSEIDDDSWPLCPGGAPELPMRLSGVQVAQFSDLLAHLHDRLQSVINAARSLSGEGQPPVRVEWIAWQRLLKVEMDIACYLRQLTEPHGDDE